MPLFSTDDPVEKVAHLEQTVTWLEAKIHLLLSDICTSEDRTRIRRELGLIPEGDEDREDTHPSAGVPDAPTS